jgi:hypothetical protein
MKVTEKRRELREVTIGRICDCCGKESTEAYPDGWHIFSSMHGEWGNDSVDSVEHWDVCNPLCFAGIIKRVLEENKGYRSLEIDDMDRGFSEKLAGYIVSC